MILPEDKRNQLDGIVKEMMSNNEPDSNIQFVVDDFKKKYSVGSEVAKQKPDVLQAAGNIVNKIFPGKQVGQSIGTLAGLGIAKLKGNAEEFDTTAPSPTQVLGDVAKGAATVAGAKLPVASSITGKVAQFGAIGGVSGAGEAAIEGESVAGGAAKGAATGAAIGAAFGVAEKGIRALGGLLGKTGDKIQTSVIKPSSADIKDGFSIENVKKYDLGGSLKATLSKTDTKLDDLTRELNTKLGSSKVPVDLNDVYEGTAKRLLGSKLENFGSNSQLEGAIEKLREEISAVAGTNGLVPITQAQVVKRAAGHFGAWQYGLTTPEATASQKVYNTFYNEMKTAIEKASPEGVKEINKQMSELIPIVNAVIRRIPIAERNQALSLTDIVSLTGAAVDPRALGVSLLNLASKSGTVGAALSKGAPKVGEAIAGGLETVERVARTAVGR